MMKKSITKEAMCARSWSAQMRNEARHLNVTPRHWNAKKKNKKQTHRFLWAADVNMFTILYKQIISYFPVT